MAGNPEQLLVTLIIPVVLLVAVVRSGLPDLSPLPQAEGGLAAALSVAVVSSAFTGQSIALAFDRRAGLLRVLVASPLGRGGIVMGRLVAVLGLIVVQVGLIVAVAVGLGIEVGPSQVASMGIVGATGGLTFAAFGLWLGGTLRAEAVLAVANLVWLAMITVGGLVLPPDRLPGGAVVAVLPPSLLGEAMRQATVNGVVEVTSIAGLAAWAVAAGVCAARWLRWD